VASRRTIIVGAGIGGLVSALLLAARGEDVLVLEAADSPGGKLSQTVIAGRAIDAGPTVFTMRGVFDEILAEAGAALDDHLTLRPADLLARHAWGPEGRFDLPADRQAAVDSVAGFFGSDEARRYVGFCTAAKAIHAAVSATFITGERPSRLSVPFRIGLGGGAAMLRYKAFSTLATALSTHFADPRLRQLFGRYATYCGSSPYLAPAILMLIAHVEQEGVWLVDGGMKSIATMLANLAIAQGADIRLNTRVAAITVDHARASGVVLASGERLKANAVIANCDVAALAGGLFGPDAARAVNAVPPGGRSLSAVTWSLLAETRGFPLARHTVFFGGNYVEEFDAIFKAGRLPAEPTVYICAEDRNASGMRLDSSSHRPERLFCLVNAPANGDTRDFSATEIEQCRTTTFSLMQRCGLQVTYDPQAIATSTPADFNRRFPGTGGALYGQANHDLNASFRRPAARTNLPGLYLAGGSVHPGPGVPMAALSGRQAATALLSDLASTRPFRRTAIAGGTSTPSATTARRG
jgi:1-hydroxycarotenoid 3,4-desaturase